MLFYKANIVLYILDQIGPICLISNLVSILINVTIFSLEVSAPCIPKGNYTIPLLSIHCFVNTSRTNKIIMIKQR